MSSNKLNAPSVRCRTSINTRSRLLCGEGFYLQTIMSGNDGKPLGEVSDAQAWFFTDGSSG